MNKNKDQAIIRYPHELKEEIENATVSAMYVQDLADTIVEKATLRDYNLKEIAKLARKRIRESRDVLEIAAWSRTLHRLERIELLEEDIARIAAELGEEGELIQFRLKNARQSRLQK